MVRRNAPEACWCGTGKVSQVNDPNSKMWSDIETYGCHILGISADAEDPNFCYSIGIEMTRKQPDLIIFGLSDQVASTLINMYCDLVGDGKSFLPGQEYLDFAEGYPVIFFPVAKLHYNRYFGRGQSAYGGTDFRVLQMVWPSREGLWPWDPAASEEYKQKSPLLDGRVLN